MRRDKVPILATSARPLKGKSWLVIPNYGLCYGIRPKLRVDILLSIHEASPKQHRWRNDSTTPSATDIESRKNLTT